MPIALKEITDLDASLEHSRAIHLQAVQKLYEQMLDIDAVYVKLQENHTVCTHMNTIRSTYQNMGTTNDDGTTLLDEIDTLSQSLIVASKDSISGKTQLINAIAECLNPSMYTLEDKPMPMH